MQQNNLWLVAVVAFCHYIFGECGPLTEDFRENPLVYCGAVQRDENKEAFKKTRSIPPLSAASEGISGLKLEQVQVMIRHGARTISSPKKCWNGYNPTWKCQSGESTSGWVKSSPSEKEITTFEFEKHFDARPRVNILKKSNCEAGQLVVDGHIQHGLNGALLADAYFMDSSSKLFLYDLNEALTSSESLDNVIYFRSTEYQRTRMSGAELITSMIRQVNGDVQDPHIHLHTLEKKVDTLHPNEESCYDLVVAKKEALSGPDYEKRFGEKHRKARDLAKQIFPEGEWPWEAHDCLFSSICVNEELPEVAPWTRPNIETIMSAAQEEYEWKFRGNDAKYSRIAMVRFMLDIKAFAIKHLCKGQVLATCIEQFFDSPTERQEHIGHITDETQIPSNPFILWSAHESTLGPFLATFGDAFWTKASTEQFTPTGDFTGFNSPYPSYASLLDIEYYSSANGPLFRMNYNGRVLTSFIPGCVEELCSVKVLFKQMSWASRDFAMTPCKLKKPKDITPPSTPGDDKKDPSGSIAVGGVSFALALTALFAAAQI